MRSYDTVTQSAEATAALAERLGRVLREQERRGAVILLHGELGAGKTTFVQGLARGMDLTDYVKSPTFVLLHEYTGGPLPLFHADFYRLSGPEEALDLGLEERAAPGVLAVEWPERAAGALPAEALRVRMAERDGDPDARAIGFEATGEVAEAVLDELAAASARGAG